MAMKTRCQTPGANFETYIGEREALGLSHIEVNVFVPFLMGLDEKEAKLLEANLHNAVELVLAPHFAGRVAPVRPQRDPNRGAHLGNERLRRRRS